MQLEVTFKNIQPREEIRRRADHLYGKLERFLDPAADARLTVSIEHEVAVLELVVNSNGVTHKANEEDPELRTALDKLFHTVESSLRRTKEKRVDRRREGRTEGEDGFEPTDESEAAS
jgi:putative sigma-54 modulation protein